MKKFLFALAAVLILIPISVRAATFKASDQDGSVNVSQTETVKNAYLAGNAINFSGKADQDVAAAGNSLNFTGSVGASLMAAGNTINISSPVGNSARVVGNIINLQNSIGSDVLAAGNSIVLNEKATVGDDFVAAGAAVDIFGKVDGNALITAAQTNINGQIDGNVTIKGGGKVFIGDNAVINGNLNYEATEPAAISQNAKILGETNFKQVSSQTQTTAGWSAKITGIVTAFSLLMVLATFLTVWLLSYLFPKLTKNYLENATAKFWENIGLGFVYLVVTPIVLIILLFTVIGIPLSGLVFAVYGVSIILAKVLVPVFVGSLLFKWFGKDKTYKITWLTILIGVMAAALIGLIPFIGGLALFVVFLMAFGQIVQSVVDFIKRQRS